MTLSLGAIHLDGALDILGSVKSKIKEAGSRQVVGTTHFSSSTSLLGFIEWGLIRLDGIQAWFLQWEKLSCSMVGCSNPMDGCSMLVGDIWILPGNICEHATTHFLGLLTQEVS